jgi:hypothetical protein
MNHKATAIKSVNFKLGILLVFICLLASCGEERHAQKIVDRAIKAHGGANYQNLEMEFDFRNYHYRMKRQNGLFAYERIFTDTAGNHIEDKLNNDGFTRKINGKEVSLTDERKNAFSNSVNSVFYFALLPYGLNDPAVIKRLVGTTNIGGTAYHVVEVTFEEEGGGEDHTDVFYFWFRDDTYYMDYLAYTYETEGGGVRFREAINPRTIDGIRFQDFKNFKPQDKNTPLSALENLYVNDELELLSIIELENIETR